MGTCTFLNVKTKIDKCQGPLISVINMVIKSYSWTVYDDKIAIKQTDLSVFKKHGSGITVIIRNYFSIDHFQKGDSASITISIDGSNYKAKLERIKSTAGQTRIMWNSDLSDVFNSKFPKVLKTHNYPELRFNRIDNTTYELDFLYPDDSEYKDGSESNLLESIVPEPGNIEGRKILYYTSKYERDPTNRKEAIRIHGTQCMACGFDFEKTYGDRGRNFIEVHHIKPLYDLNSETLINPETDLVCLCSNCHRMIHRRRDSILTLEELKELLKKNKNTTQTEAD